MPPPPPPPPPPRGIIACGPTIPYDPSVRTTFNDIGATIHAWPSRGGVIILDPACAIDFEFLHLDPLNPPLERLDDQDAEDAFCKRLLCLGAKWWDSEARWHVVGAMELAGSGGIGGGGVGGGMGGVGGRGVDGAFRLPEQPAPTMREKRLVSVGWPATGGLWVAEFDTTWGGVEEEENLCEEDMGRLAMCRTMEERCAVLRERFGARFYETLEMYEGFAFLRAWEWKMGGEVGELLQPEETVELWSQLRGRNG